MPIISSLNLVGSLVVIEIKRSFWLNELIYAWASKLGDKGILSNTGSKVHGFGSLCQTWVRITKIQIISYRMEELITLYYGNFAIFGERARDFTWCTGCSSHIADRTLRSQIFLNKLRIEYPGWGHCPQTRVETLLIGVPAPQCRLHDKRKSIKGTPKDPRLRKLKRWPLNPPPWGPS